MGTRWASGGGVPISHPRFTPEFTPCLHPILCPQVLIFQSLRERVMGLEPTTATLATWRATTELHPHAGRSPFPPKL